MNHAAIVQAESERVATHRAFILHKLDQHHFDVLNTDGHVLALNGYCLDAFDYIPAGGMQADVPGYFPQRGTYPGRQIECARGLTMADIRQREALAARLIDEILAEETAA